MPEYRFDHIHLYSPDPLRTAGFYEKTLGARRLDVEVDPEGHMVVSLVLHGIDIKVSTPWEEGSKEYGLDHFGVTTDNLDEAIAELKSSGVKFVMEKTSVPSADISFFTGPDNTLIELLKNRQEP